MNITNIATRAAWAERIKGAWQKHVGGIFDVGRLLLEAKDQLDHGEFAAMIQGDLPFKARSAQMLMEVARDDRLTNANHGSHLPASWRTLYELTKLPDDVLEAKLADGTINPETERSEILEHARSAKRAAPTGADVFKTLPEIIAAGRRYATVYADPPWSFRVYSGKGKKRSAERHYDTMTQERICALPVADVAAEDCALLMWAVMPQLPEALEVIKAWGFEYKTAGFVWVKTKPKKPTEPAMGMGYWTRSNAEICMLATRGSPRRLSKSVEQVLLAPRGAHSAKPERIAERIQKLVDGPYLELFARRQRKGWDVCGNEVESGGLFDVRAVRAA